MTDQLRDRRKRPVFIHSSLDDLPLSMEAFRVYCHLARRVNDHNEAWPSYRTLGECCFRGSYPASTSDSLRRKAISAVGELIQWNLVAVENRPANDGSQTTNLYSLTDELEWNTSNTTPSANARKSRTYQPRQKSGSVQNIPETILPFAQDCNTQSLPRIIPTHQPSDGGSLLRVMPTHHPSDVHSPPLVMPTHHPSDVHSPPLVVVACKHNWSGSQSCQFLAHINCK